MLERLDALTGGRYAAAIDAVRAIVSLYPEDAGQIQQAVSKLSSIEKMLGSTASSLDAMLADDGAQIRALVSLYPEDAGQIQQAVSKLSSIEKMLGSTASSLDAMLADDGAQIRALAEGVARKSEVQAGLEQVAAGQRRLDAERSRAERGLGQLDAARPRAWRARARCRRGLSRSRRANVAWMPNAPVPSAA